MDVAFFIKCSIFSVDILSISSVFAFLFLLAKDLPIASKILNFPKMFLGCEESFSNTSSASKPNK